MSDSSPSSKIQSKSRICVLEDDAAVSDSLQVVLGRNGFDVTTFGSAGEFLASHTADSYDCLIVDLGLPLMSGLELIEVLRGRAYSKPAVLIWGRPEGRLLPRIRRAGIAETLAKPVAPAELLDALRKAVAAGPLRT
jgi:FixJ family two-component response regulator